jgi:hypothetical protein
MVVPVMDDQSIDLANVYPVALHKCFNKLIRIAFPVNHDGDFFIAEAANVASWTILGD